MAPGVVDGWVDVDDESPHSLDGYLRTWGEAIGWKEEGELG